MCLFALRPHLSGCLHHGSDYDHRLDTNFWHYSRACRMLNRLHSAIHFLPQSVQYGRKGSGVSSQSETQIRRRNGHENLRLRILAPGYPLFLHVKLLQFHKDAAMIQQNDIRDVKCSKLNYLIFSDSIVRTQNSNS